MRHFLLIFGVLLGFAVGPIRAQSNDPADYFLNAYTAFQKGEKAEGAASFRTAAGAYKQAIGACDQISSRWPNWQPPIVKYRRDRSAEALARVQPKVGKAGDKSSDEDMAGPLPGAELPLLPDDLPAAEAAPSGPTAARGTGGDPIMEIQSRLKSLQDDLRTTREKLERETADKQELARKYEQAMKSAQESGEKQAIAEGRAQRAEEALMKAEGDGMKNTDQLKALRAEVDASRKAIRDIQIDREAGEELRQQVGDRLANANKRIETLAQERDAARKESADVPKKIGEMQKQLDKAVKEKGDISTKLAKVEGQLKDVTQQRDDALQQVAKMKEAQKQVDSLIADNTALMAKLEDAQKTITQFKAEGTKKTEEIATLKKEVTSVKKQLVETKKQSIDYQQQMSDLHGQLDNRAKDLADVKTTSNTTVTERKRLQQENDILRGIVIRQQKEQAIRDGKRKLVLTELNKLELNSKALVTQIEYLTSPVVKLTAKERKLFKQPLMEITDAEISLAAPREESTAGSEAASESPGATEGASPTSETPPAASENETASATSDEAAAVAKEPTIEIKPIALDPTAQPDVTTKGSATLESQPFELASAAPAGIAPLIPSSKSTEADLPVKSIEEKKTTEESKSPDEKKEENAAAPAVATNLSPNVPPDLLGLAREGKDHFERGNYRDAEKIYDKILTKAPNNLYALSNLGVVRFRSGKLKLAEEAFKKAIAVAPEDAFSHCTLGIVYYSQGKYDEAVTELTKAVAINPKNATAHNYLGITASQKGWQEAAQTELEAATALDPNYADAFFNLAVVYATQQPPNKETARKHYKRATQLGAEPDSALEQLIK